MVQAGANIIELGVPFSDPMADGTTIQLAHERALLHNTSLTSVLDMVQQFRQTDNHTPVVLMGYLNPVEVMGYVAFAKAAQAAGVDGALLVDLPPEEGVDVLPVFKQHDVDTIFLISPTTPASRIQAIAQVGSGYLYYVSLKGVTGANSLDVGKVAQRLDEIRHYTNLPVGVGFGIKDAATAQAVAQVADAVVVGSALVKLVEATPNDAHAITMNISQLLATMRHAMDSNR
jgi:tryptophan synthase alpha chain